MWGCFVWYRRMTLLTKTRNFSLSIRPPFRAEKEIVKSLRELLKYKIKIENGNQFSDFFFFLKRNNLGKHNKRELSQSY